MNCCLQWVNQPTRSASRVSVITQVAQRIGKCQTKTIQSTSRISITPLGLFCNKPAVVFVAGLIMRAAAIPPDKFPRNWTLILSVGHLNSFLPMEDNRGIPIAIKCCSTSVRLHSWERQPIRAGLLARRSEKKENRLENRNVTPTATVLDRYKLRYDCVWQNLQHQVKGSWKRARAWF